MPLGVNSSIDFDKHIRIPQTIHAKITQKSRDFYYTTGTAARQTGGRTPSDRQQTVALCPTRQNCLVASRCVVWFELSRQQYECVQSKCPIHTADAMRPGAQPLLQSRGGPISWSGVSLPFSRKTNLERYTKFGATKSLTHQKATWRLGSSVFWRVGGSRAPDTQWLRPWMRQSSFIESGRAVCDAIALPPPV